MSSEFRDVSGMLTSRPSTSSRFRRSAVDGGECRVRARWYVLVYERLSSLPVTGAFSRDMHAADFPIA